MSISHEALTTWVELLTFLVPILATILGFGARGWLKAWELEKQAATQKQEEFEKSLAAAWKKMDDLREQSARFVDRASFEKALQNMADVQAKATADLNRSLTDAINRLSDRLDRFVEGKNK